MATHQHHRNEHDERDDAITTETTPLLAASSSPVVPAGDPEDAKALITSTSSISASSSSNPAPTSLPEQASFPKVQVLLLCYARLIEPIAFFSIFPYINEMVLRNGHGSIAESDMGFYSGLIESLFSLTQMLVMVPWGRAADRLGRKPVLVFSLLGVAVASSLFGMARTIWQMILFRCAAGVFAGSIVTVRAMISENAGRENQALAFSWFAVAGNLGIFIGPLLGGALADPARLYPRVFRGVWFFEEFPYALSSLVIGVIGLTAVITSALFVKETLPREKPQPDGEVGAQVPRHRASTWDLLTAPGVGIVLYNYGHAMLLAFAYTAVVPVFWATAVDLGGLGFSPLQISLFMGLTGLSQAVWLLLVFPPLQRRLGTNGVMRLCGGAYPFFLGLMPLLTFTLRFHTSAGNTAFWILAPLLLSLGPGVSMAFTGVQLALNDVSPSHETLGMLNALALTLVSGLRSFSPALFASLFAVGVRNQYLSGYFVWVILFILAVGFTVSTRFLPETSEKQQSETTGDRHEDGDDDSLQ
ncbi:major facilitator superfamily domain-containing protein [Xylaria flabelliformis]|nr:major facilitator superfamily domain-containing protein [Xylaria flabelliformis]